MMREPGARAIALQQHVGRDFEDGIADEEQARTQPEGCGADAEIGQR
jgi:hypothetical protein